MSPDRMQHTAAELRRAFDETFSRSAQPMEEAQEDFLAVRAQESLLAFRAEQIAGVTRLPPVTPVPSQAPALIGLGSVRGSLVVLYSLAGLVTGISPPASGKWVVLCGPERSVGLVFEEIQGYIRVPSRDVHRREEPRTQATTQEILRSGETSRLVLSIPAILEAFSRRTALVPARLAVE